MTAADASLGRWMVALAPRLGTVVRCHLPGGPLNARRRELVSQAVAESLGSASLAQVHAEWQRLLGPADLGDVDDDVLGWVGAVARARHPNIDLDGLPRELSPDAQAAIGALVAHGVVAAATLERGGSLLSQLRAPSSLRPRQAASDLAAMAVGLPVAAPPVALGVVVARLGRLAPPELIVEVDAEANLLTQLLAEVLPNWLGSAWGRTLVAHLPVEVPVAVRAGQTGSTVRIGRGALRVVDGLDDDAWALFDGDVDALVRAGSDGLSREVRSARLGL